MSATHVTPRPVPTRPRSRWIAAVLAAFVAAATIILVLALTDSATSAGRSHATTSRLAQIKPPYTRSEHEHGDVP